MDEHLQSILALSAVAVTALLFVLRYFLNRKSGACSSGCGCGLPEKISKQSNRQPLNEYLSEDA